jgi:hypothetical protein
VAGQGPPDGLGDAGLNRGPVRWSGVLESGGDLGAALDALGLARGGLPVLDAGGTRLLGVLRPEDVPADGTGPDGEAVPTARCVVELLDDPPEGWSAPAGFTRLDGGTGRMLLVGPSDGLDALVAGLSGGNGTPP